jgi:hypothetical protein
VRESHVCEASRRVSLVAEAVTRLLTGRAVVAKPIRLDHQPEIRPIEVDSESIDAGLRLRHAKPRTVNDGKKPPLELGISEDEGAPVEQCSEGSHSPLPLALIELRLQLLRIDQVELVRRVDRCLELAWSKVNGDVKQRPDGCRHRNPGAAGRITLEKGAAMGDDVALTPDAAFGDRHVEDALPLGADPP